ETYISDLDEALNIIAKLGILYETLPHPDQKELLRNVVERVVLNPEGKIIRVDWLPPFAYLQEVSEKVSGGRSSSENLAENQTSGNAGRSSGVLDCGHYRTRTFGSTAFRCMKHQRFSTRRCRFSQRPKLDLNYASQQKSTSETFSSTFFTCRWGNRSQIFSGDHIFAELPQLKVMSPQLGRADQTNPVPDGIRTQGEEIGRTSGREI